MPTQCFLDQLAREVFLSFPPERIISLVPSQTELLADLGLDQQVLGITKFCIHPPHWFRSKTRIGGTKTLNLDLIRQLNPQLILGNKEENQQSQMEILMEEFPVWISDIHTVDDALQMIRTVGGMTNSLAKSELIVSDILKGFNQLKDNQMTKVNAGPKAAYFIWKDPWMVAGGNTFIQDMMKLAGFENIFQFQEGYPAIQLNQLQALHPEVILLSSEPFPFKEKHLEEIGHFISDCKIKMVDGEMFSWYGSRMIQFPEYLKNAHLQPMD
ncbi:MAG: ABC transporter substrate-binding protein [Chitinophagaceae bacterium]